MLQLNIIVTKTNRNAILLMKRKKTKGTDLILKTMDNLGNERTKFLIQFYMLKRFNLTIIMSCHDVQRWTWLYFLKIRLILSWKVIKKTISSLHCISRCDCPIFLYIRKLEIYDFRIRLLNDVCLYQTLVLILNINIYKTLVGYVCVEC